LLRCNNDVEYNYIPGEECILLLVFLNNENRCYIFLINHPYLYFFFPQLIPYLHNGSRTLFASFNCGTIQWISPQLSTGMSSKFYRVNATVIGIGLVPI